MALIDTVRPQVPSVPSGGTDQFTSRLQRTVTAEWQALPYRKDRFTASDDEAWSVPTNGLRARYRVAGTALYLDFEILRSTVTGTPVELRMALPDGYMSHYRKTAVVAALDNGTPLMVLARTDDSGTVLRFLVDLAGTPWSTAAATTEITGQIVLEVRPTR